MVQCKGAAFSMLCFMSGVFTIEAFVPTTSIRQNAAHRVMPSSTASIRRKSVEQQAIKMPSVAIPIPSINLSYDWSATSQYFVETLISNGIPAFFWIVVIAFAAKSFTVSSTRLTLASVSFYVKKSQLFSNILISIK